VRVAILAREVTPEGGLTLASFRLATALAEAGLGAEVFYAEGEPPPHSVAVGRRVEIGPAGEAPSPALRRALEHGDPDLVLVGSGEPGLLRVAASVAPTCLHAHLHFGICADEARYWSRLKRPCAIGAGRRCALVRPLLACTDTRRALDPRRVAEQRHALETIADERIGVVCVGTDQAELYAAHGLPSERVTVLPNLGIRAAAAELETASAQTPEAWRSATAFVGRLSKEKGGQVLGRLAAMLAPESRLRVFGDGYLAGRLAARAPEGVLCGHVSQQAVLGALMWARSTVFPSLWPEPGGIVGIDAQVIGVPLTAFDVGAARYWPGAKRFPLGDLEAMASWLGERGPRDRPQDPEEVAEAQAGYWRRIAARGADAFASFAAERRFAPLGDGPAEELIREPGRELAV